MIDAITNILMVDAEGMWAFEHCWTLVPFAR
jgi:hypothetical protein